MGYDIHITRQSDWADAKPTKKISREEWLEYAMRDPSLRRSETNGPAFFECTDIPQAWFDWTDGHVHTKNADEKTLAKSHALAAALRAKVQGDDGEIYLPNGETIDNSPQVVTRYPLWLLYLCLFAFSCFLVAILHVAGVI